MSLIDEALKRAQAAADRDAPRLRPWVPTPMPDAGLARRRWLVRAALSGLAAGVGLAALAALLIWAARGSRPAAPGPHAAAPESAVPVPTEARPPGGGGDGARPARAGAVAAADPTPVAATRAASSGRRPQELVPSIDPTPIHVAPPPVPAVLVASASGSPAARASAAGRSYHGKVTLPDGGSLELGGIVWSDEDPRALVNDRVVGVGAYVQGYTIEKIEEDRVVLEKDGKRITVTVK
jgi:hypothetical protein